MNSQASNLPNHHLTEEQLDDLLLGEPSAAATAHLHSCAACRARVQAFEIPLALFNQFTLQQAQARSAAMPVPRPRRTALFGMSYGAAWSFAGTAAVAVALVLTLAPRHTADAPPQLTATAAVAAPTGADRQAEIASDNAMLSAIDTALYHGEPAAGALFAPAHDRSSDTGLERTAQN